MIGSMVRHFISREANVVLKIYKILIRLHIVSYTQALSPVSRHGNWSVLLRLEDIQKRVGTNNFF